MMVEVDRLKQHIEGYSELKDGLARFLGLAEAKSVYDLKNEILDEVRKVIPVGGDFPSVPLPNQPGPATLTRTETVVQVEKSEERVRFNTKTLDGKIMALGQEGFLEAWRALGEIEDALENKGWTAEKEKVKEALKLLKDKGYIGYKPHPKKGTIYKRPELVRYEKVKE